MLHCFSHTGYYSSLCQCGVLVPMQHFRGVHNTFGCVGWLGRMAAVPRVAIRWRAQGKVCVGPESAAFGFNWRAQRKVCVGLGSAALTRVTVLGIALRSARAAARITDCGITDSRGLRTVCGIAVGTDCGITDYPRGR